MTFTGTRRLVVGAGLVAAGGQLAAPLAGKLLAALRSPAATAVETPAVPAAAVPAGLPVAAASASPGADVPLAGDPWSGLPAGVPSDSAGGLQLDRCPPPPPAPLPPVPPEFEQAGPPLGGAYRSTLRVPPPDLLDAEGPPPARSWATPVAVTTELVVPVAARPVADVTVPATYRIQDGDDLNAIAGRFYGHPAAAAAIWSANRNVIPNPELLPIGAELQLPPPWAVRGRGASGAIEPAAYARPIATPVPAGTGRPTGVGPRLPTVPVQSVEPPAPPVRAAATPLPPAVVSVRLGPGESLTTLARRLYGDEGMAGQIYAMNRDRLRSPELAVAGMELRLPRPVTVPQP